MVQLHNLETQEFANTCAPPPSSPTCSHKNSFILKPPCIINTLISNVHIPRILRNIRLKWRFSTTVWKEETMNFKYLICYFQKICTKMNTELQFYSQPYNRLLTSTQLSRGKKMFKVINSPATQDTKQSKSQDLCQQDRLMDYISFSTYPGTWNEFSDVGMGSPWLRWWRARKDLSCANGGGLCTDLGPVTKGIMRMSQTKVQFAVQEAWK